MLKNLCTCPQLLKFLSHSINTCKQISKKQSCDIKGLSQAIVLSDIDIISPIVTHIANCSFESGICPDLTKIARVIPVFKEKGENYLYSKTSNRSVYQFFLRRYLGSSLSDRK